MLADAGGARARRRRRRSPLLKFFFVFSIVLVQYLVLWLISTSLIFKSFELELTFHLKHSVPVTTLLPQLEASIASDGSTTGSEIVSGLSRRSILKSFISCWRRSLLSDSQSSKGCVKFPFSKQIGSYLHLYSTTKALRVGLKIDPPIHLLRRVQSLPVTAPLSHLPAWFFSAPICSSLSRHRESSIVATKGKLGFPLVGWSNFGPLTFSSWPITRSGCPLYICSGPWPARPTNLTKHVELRSQHLELVYRRFLGASVSFKRQRGMIRSLVSISRCIFPKCRGLSSKDVLAWRQVLAKSSPVALGLNVLLFQLPCLIPVEFRQLFIHSPLGFSTGENTKKTSFRWDRERSLTTFTFSSLEEKTLPSESLLTRGVLLMDQTPKKLFWATFNCSAAFLPDFVGLLQPRFSIVEKTSELMKHMWVSIASVWSKVSMNRQRAREISLFLSVAGNYLAGSGMLFKESQSFYFQSLGTKVVLIVWPSFSFVSSLRERSISSFSSLLERTFPPTFSFIEIVFKRSAIEAYRATFVRLPILVEELALLKVLRVIICDCSLISYPFNALYSLYVSNSNSLARSSRIQWIVTED